MSNRTEHRSILTSHGEIQVDLQTRAGRVTGAITLPASIGGSYNDDALDAFTSLILAHACAGVDVESKAYVKGASVALDAIGNRE